MKKIISLILAAILFLIAFFCCYNYHLNNSILDTKIKEMINGMTLDEKIGQMLYISYPTLTVDDSLSNLISDVKPGGFILFDNNIDNKAQLKSLITGLQTKSTIPMFIGIDQEGGTVQRLKKKNDINVITIPSMYDVGQMADTNLAYDVGKVIGEELNVFGINMDFAPSLDIWSNPNNTVIGKRSFGNNAKIVSEMGLSLAKGINDSSVIAVYKHFPGHGGTDIDSHYALPILNKTMTEMKQLELIPFINAVKAKADIMMIGHIALPKITGDNTPSSLSSKLINNYLRNELCFNGVVITDSVKMKALSDNYTINEICINAIKAGVDIILMPEDPRVARDSIKNGISEGLITENQIDIAVARILRLKLERGLFNVQTLSSDSVLNDKEHQLIISKVKVNE